MAVNPVHLDVKGVGFVLQASWTGFEAVAARCDDFAAYLSADEIAKADAFRAARDRDRYIVRHGWMREQLAAELGQHPARLTFAYNDFGKPCLAGSGLGFSLSQSRGAVLLVCGPVAEIGCDMEWRDPSLDPSEIAARFFSRAEREALHLLATEHRLAGFYHGWTRKEAYVKARGCGLSMPLDSFDVELAPSRVARLLRGCEGWSVASFDPLPGFQAAVVAPGNWQLKLATSCCSALWDKLELIQNLEVQ